MRNKSLAVITVLLIAAIGVAISCVVVLWSANSEPSPDEASIALDGFTWDHSSIRVLIVTSEGEPWWQSAYVNSVLRAIGVWNDAFKTFAENHSIYAYMSRLNIVSEGSNVCHPGYDVYVFWTNEQLTERDAGGYARTYSAGGVAQNSTITLAVHSELEVSLSEIDMQNIAVHELGHSLGLGHCEFGGDMMYATSLLSSPARGVSSLDVLGVARVFGWMAESSEFRGIEDWPESGSESVSLPSDVQYVTFASGNLPGYSVLEPLVGSMRVFFELMLKHVSLRILIGGIVVVLVLAAGVAVYRRRSR